jgi:hypothetical protein
VELVAVEACVAIAYGCDDDFGDFGQGEKPWTGGGFIQNPVHGYECFSVCQMAGCKHTASGQTAMQPESYEERMTDEVPMGEAAFVMGHR